MKPISLSAASYYSNLGLVLSILSFSSFHFSIVATFTPLFLAGGQELPAQLPKLLFMQYIL